MSLSSDAWRSPRALLLLCACNFPVVLGADADTGVRRSLLGSHRAEANDDETVPTTTLTPTQMERLAKFSEDVAWKIGGMATNARSVTSRLRSAVAHKKSYDAAKEARNSGLESPALAAQASAVEQQANISLQAALGAELDARSLEDGIAKRAYAVAKAGADKRVGKLEAEAKTYFQDLVKDLTEIPPPVYGPQQAAAKAAKPYVDVQLRVTALVASYNEKATQCIVDAQNLVVTAFGIANHATLEQAAGDGVMAQRYMIQAHNCIGAANLKKDEAKKIRILVENLNSSIPSYQKAAQMAVEHALATFSGLQQASRGRKSSRQWTNMLDALDTDIEKVTLKLTDLADRHTP